MSLALAVLLVGVLNGHLLVHQDLAIHVGDGGIGGFKVGEGNESVTLGEVVVVAGNLEKKESD